MESYLEKRFEFKYVLDIVKAHKVEVYFQKLGVLERDGYSENGPYIVNSLYYDTPQLDDHRDKDASLLIRRKMRARMYQSSWFDEHKTIWLEVKKKRNMNISKVRVGVSGTAWKEFMVDGDTSKLYDNNISSEDREKLDEFVFTYRRHMYRPHVVVKYDRTAYLANFVSPVRITFDKNITTCYAGDSEAEQSMMAVSKDRVVMELKYNGTTPWWVSEALIKFNLEREDFSKYRHSSAMLRGLYRIPVNK